MRYLLDVNTICMIILINIDILTGQVYNINGQVVIGGNMNKRFLYIEIMENLKELISTMQAKERIPSRNELMQKFNVTRTTIDRAISELVDEGCLYAIDGSGHLVAERKPVDKENRLPNIGIIIPNIVSHEYPEIVRGIQDIADSKQLSCYHL